MLYYNASRAIVRPLASGGGSLLSSYRVTQLTQQSLRVLASQSNIATLLNGKEWKPNVILAIGQRLLATKAASRPKAHTGRSTTSTRATKKTTSATKTARSGAKKPSISKARATKAKKTKPKTTKPKKPKTSTSGRGRTPKTAQQVELAKVKKARERLVELKARALQVPKRLPATAFLVLSTEMGKQNHRVMGKEAGEKYKALTPEELEVKLQSFPLHPILTRGLLRLPFRSFASQHADWLASGVKSITITSPTKTSRPTKPPTASGSVSTRPSRSAKPTAPGDS